MALGAKMIGSKWKKNATLKRERRTANNGVQPQTEYETLATRSSKAARDELKNVYQSKEPVMFAHVW
jgi:hypothetical protein